MTEKPRVLFVDDEQNFLDAVKRHLRRHYEVHTAAGGIAALEAIEREGPFAVVVSDMRMPRMNGAEFLKRAREEAPHTVRVLLTGYADIEDAIRAVNEGQIFSFMKKPCPLNKMVEVLDMAVEHHRLVTAERVLLEQTLRGSVKALTDVLALASPVAFGRASRAKSLASELLDQLGLKDQWAVEVAAMLSQLGCVTLPPETAEKLYHGAALEATEQVLVDRLPEVTQQLLAHIPRLEPVREILRYQRTRFDGLGSPEPRRSGERLPLGARILHIVLDYDTLLAQGKAPQAALVSLQTRSETYDPKLLAAFCDVRGKKDEEVQVEVIEVRHIRPGMIFADDLISSTGNLLIARGQEVSESLCDRIRHWAGTDSIEDRLRMIIPG